MDPIEACLLGAYRAEPRSGDVLVIPSRGGT